MSWKVNILSKTISLDGIRISVVFSNENQDIPKNYMGANTTEIKNAIVADIIKLNNLTKEVDKITLGVQDA